MTRQRVLQQQFHDAGCHIVALQETRHKRLVDKQNPLYHLVGHCADNRGQDGIQLWISKTKPLFAGGSLVTMKHILIVEANPSFLVVKLQLPEWHCLLVTGRAPHSGHGEQTIAAYWHFASSTIRKFERDWPVFFLGDTNGHLGQHPSEAVGDLAPATENLAGHFFHDWMLSHSLFAPSCFAAHHEGSLHDTFVSPDGEHSARIDYIALPRNFEYEQITTRVDDTLDVSLHRPDHFPFVCHLKFSHRVPSSRRTRHGRQRFNMAEFAYNMQATSNHHFLRASLPNPAWSMDPHASADLLAWQTSQAVAEIAPAGSKWKRKHHLLPETWELIEQKKAAFRQIKTLQRAQRQTALKALFMSWRYVVQVSSDLGLPHSALLRDLPGWLEAGSIILKSWKLAKPFLHKPYTSDAFNAIGKKLTNMILFVISIWRSFPPWRKSKNYVFAKNLIKHLDLMVCLQMFAGLARQPLPQLCITST